MGRNHPLGSANYGMSQRILLPIGRRGLEL